MACFIVPAAEAVAVTALTKIAEKNQKKNEAVQALNTTGKMTDGVSEEKQTITLTEKAKWLRNLLWGGSAMLAFEHLWHGEITLTFPFLTAMGDPADTARMLHEMSTVGVGMAVIVTAAWGLMALTTSRIGKKKKAQEK